VPYFTWYPAISKNVKTRKISYKGRKAYLYIIC